MSSWTMWDSFVVLAYLVSCLAIGYYANRRATLTSTDYVIAGRTLPFGIILATLVATNMGGGSALGRSGLAWSEGAGAVMPFMGGWLIGIPLLIFLAGKIRATGCVSIAEIFYKRYGKSAQIVASIIVAINALLFVALQYLAFGTVLSFAASSLGIGKEIGAVIGFIVTIVYTTIGGFYAVVWSDVLQFIVFLGTVVVILPITLMSATGGVSEIARFAVMNKLPLLNPFGQFSIALLSLLFLWAAVWVTDPMIYQRVLASRDNKTIKKALLAYIPCEAVFGFAIVFITVGARMLMPNLPQTAGTVEAVLPMVVIRYLPPVLTGLAFSALIAILMSTIDSCLLVASTTILQDILTPLVPRLSRQHDHLSYMRIVTLIVGLVALGISFAFPTVWFAMVFALSAYTPAILWPLVLGLLWVKASKQGAIITMISVWLFVAIIVLGRIQIMGLPPDVASVLIGIPLGGALMWISSSLTFRLDPQPVQTSQDR